MKANKITRKLSFPMLSFASFVMFCSSAFAEAEHFTFFSNRGGEYLNCFDSTGSCETVKHWNGETSKSDELFTLIDLNGDELLNGDAIMLKTRSGYYVNSHDSKGSISAIPTFSSDINSSDEIFRIYKVRGSSGGNQIKFKDKVIINTRSGYAFNCHPQNKNCQAIPTANRDPAVSDEVFTIYLDAVVK